MKVLVELTEGWDGKALASAVMLAKGDGRDGCPAVSGDAVRWLAGRAHFSGESVVRIVRNTEKAVVDFGSWRTFGRVTVLDMDN